MVNKKDAQRAAAVDFLVDENGEELDVPDNSRIHGATGVEETVGSTGPTNWWRLGLIALAVVAAILLGLQLLNGVPSTDVQPGTPTAKPETIAQ